jgi:hypothetical protein
MCQYIRFNAVAHESHGDRPFGNLDADASDRRLDNLRRLSAYGNGVASSAQ